MKRCLALALSIYPSDYTELRAIFFSHDIEIRSNPLGRKPTDNELTSMLEGVDGVLAGSETYNGSVFGSARNLRIVARVGVGYENVDIKAATQHHVVVTWTPIPELAVSVAEETFALILSLLKRTPQRDYEMREGRYDTSVPTSDAFSLTLGILGLGRIGFEVAKRAKSFEMRLLYHDSVRKKELEQELGITYVSFDTLLKESDIVSVHIPHTSETNRIVGADEFGQMKKDAYLINTARGAIIDEKALLEALEDEKIAGAALAVYSQEPPTEKHPFYKIDRRLPNTILVPHMAVGATTRKAMMRAAAEDVIAVLEGKKPRYPLN